MQIVVVNAGSSSLKLRCLDSADAVVTSEDLPALPTDQLDQALERFLAGCPPPDAVGHRVVHGGTRYTEALLLDDRAEDDLNQLGDLAPLHNPPSLEAIGAMSRVRPDVPQVACFDTAFHASMPPEAASYAVPASWAERWGIRRFGFHGLSHAWASRRAAQLLGRPATQLRLVTAHLGAGASLAAVSAGRSVDTTMGFTPLEGLVMATRSGTVDPGLVLWLQTHGGLSVSEVEHALEHESGLLGLSGRSGDLREVLDGVDRGDRPATLAYSVYLHRLCAGIGSMLAALGGWDGLVFTGGAGERSARLRADTCTRLGFLGLRVAEAANAAAVGTDALISPPGSPVAAMVVAAREDLEIARQVRSLLAPG